MPNTHGKDKAAPAAVINAANEALFQENCSLRQNTYAAAAAAKAENPCSQPLPHPQQPALAPAKAAASG